MPVVVPTLTDLFQKNIDANMTPLGGSPLGQAQPQYFKMLCQALAAGIASQATITFTTVDAGSMAAPPIPGAGVGVGILIDDLFLSEQIYTNLRNQSLSSFGKTNHAPWPPPKGDTGEFLKALSDGIALSIKTHFTTCWNLTSVHPLVYAGAGNIVNGGFSGVSDSGIASATVAAGGGMLAGPFFPVMAQKIAEAIKLTIETKSTGVVTIAGICVPNPSQACGIGGSGVGTGVAS